MYICCLRRISRIYFHDRPDHYKVPIRTSSSNGAQQLTVQPLIQHAVEAHPRSGNGSLVLRFRDRVSGFPKMFCVNAAGKRVDTVMLPALSFIKTLSTGKNQISGTEQIAFHDAQERRGTLESRELIHAVIDCGPWPEMVTELQGHGRVIPTAMLLDVLFNHETIQHFTLNAVYYIRGPLA